MIRDFYDRWMRFAAGLIDSVRPADGPPPGELWGFVRWCVAGAWPVLGIATLISAATGATEVLTMWLLGRAVDAASVPGGGNFWAQHWGIAVGAVFLLMIARPLLFGLSATFQTVVIAPSVFTLTLSRLHRWTLGHSVTFFDNDFAGRLAQKQMQAARSLTESIVETVNAVLFGISSIVGAAALVGVVNPWLAAILVGWFCLYALFLRVMLPKVRQRAKSRAAARAMVSGQVVDTITNIKTVKLFARAQHEDSAALSAMEGFEQASMDFGRVSALFRLGLMFIAGCLPVVLVGVALSLRGSGVTPGDIASVGAVSIRLAQMTGWISFTLMGIYGHVGEVEDGMNTLTPPHALTDRHDADELEVTKGEITFENVRFAYGGETGGLHGIDLTVKPGEKLGIVGASGAGKSTLVAVLLRLYDTEEGRVLIDGQDIAQVTQESLRAAIGMVTQETAMFNRSARDNIMYGRPEATEEEMIAATEKAEALDFVRDLRDFRDREGFDAYLGERGVKLSGGQRQRIAIARAILKDAPILVLDEATSALDSEVEASIQTALESAMEGKTVVAIAHRLSTIADMDRIVVLHEGRIVEEGTHDSLLAREGYYARYWHRQSGGFTRDAAE